MTRHQKLFAQFVRFTDDNQHRAAELLGVAQASVSRYVNGLSVPMAPVVLLARRILIEAGKRPQG